MIEVLNMVFLISIIFIVLFCLRRVEISLKKEMKVNTKQNLEDLLKMLEKHKESLDGEVREISKMYLNEISDLLEEYKNHLQIVNEFETYSGDEIIANLLRHTRSIIKNIEEFRNTEMQNVSDGGVEDTNINDK